MLRTKMKQFLQEDESFPIKVHAISMSNKITINNGTSIITIGTLAFNVGTFINIIGALTFSVGTFVKTDAIRINNNLLTLNFKDEP